MTNYYVKCFNIQPNSETGRVFLQIGKGSISEKVIIENWLEAFNRLLENPRVDIIAHPLWELKGFGIREEELPMEEITDSIVASGGQNS